MEIINILLGRMMHCAPLIEYYIQKSMQNLKYQLKSTVSL